jgi:hypothetical protein
MNTHPEGQQAGSSSASTAHVWPFWQQMSRNLSPSSSEHRNVLAGHESSRLKMTDAGGM